MEATESVEYCPICYKLLSVVDIENHVNKCIFLNSVDKQDNKQKRKRCASPTVCDDLQEDGEHSHTLNKKCKKDNTLKTIGNSYDYKASSGDQNRTNSKNVPSFATTISQHMQPNILDEFVGQDKVLGKNTFLRSLLEDNEIPNMILWGPPGCGKTSLANVISEMCKISHHQYVYIGTCAVNCGVNEIINIINQTKRETKCSQRIVLFIDEVHKFNRRQQNMLLAQVPATNVILVVATTENPSFNMTESFLNRCKVIVMEKLKVSHLISIVERALATFNVKIIDDANTVRNLFQNNNFNSLCIQQSAVRWLAETTDGDARIALNNLQLILQHCQHKKLGSIVDIKNEIKKSHLVYDRNGEEHHNIICAMHESIKGYNDNAALYWTTRMIVGGEDPLFIARRLVRAASEDIGNADPTALRLAISTMQGCQQIGMPDSEVLLAQCATYLARAPTTKQTKSALALVKQVIFNTLGQQPHVPFHLQNVPVKLTRELGFEEVSNKCRRTFMPAGLENVKFL